MDRFGPRGRMATLFAVFGFRPWSLRLPVVDCVFGHGPLVHAVQKSLFCSETATGLHHPWLGVRKKTNIFSIMRIFNFLCLFRIPSAIVVALLLIVKKEVISSGGRDPNFTYGEIQAIVAAFLLIVCFLGKSKFKLKLWSLSNFFLTVTVGCLILHQRYRQRYSRYLLLVQDVGAEGNIQNAESSDEEDEGVGSEPKTHSTDSCSLKGDAACDGKGSGEGCSTSGGNTLINLYLIYLTTNLVISLLLENRGHRRYHCESTNEK
jgi:hypothetical protein